MSPTRRARNASKIFDPGCIPTDLELGKFYVKDLWSQYSWLHLGTIRGRAALVKWIEQTRSNTKNLLGTPPLHKMAATKWKIVMDLKSNSRSFKSKNFWTGNLHRMDFYQPASQLTQVQSIVLNEAMEKAASAATQSAVRAFSCSSLTAPASTIPERESSGNEARTSSAGIIDAPVSSGATLKHFAFCDSSKFFNCGHNSGFRARATCQTCSGNPQWWVYGAILIASKDFDTLNPSEDEPLIVTIENSVIKLNKTNVSSITHIEEWTTAFTASMGVFISTFPHRSSELPEYMSLIRYEARYHKGLGWCVYDIKFR